jgi:hypothetical protein
MDASRQQSESESPTCRDIYGSDTIDIYGPFSGLGLNAERHKCGAQSWTRNNRFNPDEFQTFVGRC